MAVNIPAVVVMVLFYLLILGIGIYAGCKKNRTSTVAEVFLANRQMGFFVSMMSLTATNVGGAYLNGTAEIVASKGLLWAQAPICYCIALFFGGWFYGPRMRKAGYITMYDPFLEKYGSVVGTLMCIPEFVGDVFWTAAILSALGSTTSIIMDLDKTTSIVVSACIAIFYTFLGGLRSVAYTDVVQLIFIGVGLVIDFKIRSNYIIYAFSAIGMPFYLHIAHFLQTLAFPFTLKNPAVHLQELGTSWVGHVPLKEVGQYIDLYCLLIMGGIPWQPFYQRVLACRNPDIAKKSLMTASIFCLLFAVPPAIMGAVGAATNWNETLYPGEVPLEDSMLPFILPLGLQYLTPLPVAVIGLAAIAAAAMSSADSTTLSTASIFTNNVYRGLFRKRATDRELIWVLRITVVVAGALGTVLAIVSSTVYGLYVMSSDLMYVILFPQLTSVLFIKVANGYGSLTGFVVAAMFRLLSGERLIGLPEVIRFPYYDEEIGQLFPFRTLIMLSSFASIIAVSVITNMAFKNGWVPIKLDVLGYFKDPKNDLNISLDGEENEIKGLRCEETLIEQT